MKKFLLLIFCTLYILPARSDSGYKFRITLKDKGESSFSINKPEEFLSPKTIERRKKQNIAIHASDLPISPAYLKAIEDTGCKIVSKSKWTETVSIHCEDSSIVARIRKLDFVKQADCVWIGKSSPTLKTRSNITKAHTSETPPSNEYGYGWNQMEMVNGQFLHQKGYGGEGIQIAVIDAGFSGLENNPLMENINILGTKKFVYEDDSPQVSHGYEVLSLMAANQPYFYTGSAPKAGYWLLWTEDNNYESPIEEDYWAAAAEYADSLGVDIINSSLGYYHFEEPFKSYSWSDLDGKTSLITRAAETASQKGIFVTISAGNEAQKEWKKIIVPADAENVLTVGSVELDATISPFSSIGFADNRIKPDVSALGGEVYFFRPDGSLYWGKGTSYSTPFICGMAACLWEAFPKLTNRELADIIRRSAHQYESPDPYYGHGIPDMEKAYELATETTSGITEWYTDESLFEIYSCGENCITIKNKSHYESLYATVYTLEGRIIFRTRINNPEQSFIIPSVNNKLCIISLRNEFVKFSKKIKL